MTEKQLPEKARGEGVWEGILSALMALPGVKVDRASFLVSRLQNYCNEEQVHAAIQFRPAVAGIAPEVIDKLADACIRSHVVKASGTSFVAGLPGGLAMVGTIPADVVQFQRHALILSQRLAYLYGWPDLLENGEIDEETELHLTLLIGAMMGAEAANQVLLELADRLATRVARQLPRHALTKTAWYPIVKQVGKWLGINVTKRGVAGTLAKAIPIVGGAASAGVTAATMRPMARRLKGHLRRLRYALPDECAGGRSIEEH